MLPLLLAQLKEPKPVGHKYLIRTYLGKLSLLVVDSILPTLSTPTLSALSYFGIPVNLESKLIWLAVLRNKLPVHINTLRNARSQQSERKG